MGYWFTTEVEPRCDECYLLRHLLRKVGGRESTYSGSENFVMTRTDYVCSDSEDEVALRTSKIGRAHV